MKNLLIIFVALLTITSCKNDADNFQQEVLTNDPAAHQYHRRCISDKKMSSVYTNDPTYRHDIEKGRSIARQELLNPTIRGDQDILTIPVHVIIVHSSNTPIGQGNNLSENRVLDQMKRLNTDFRLSNADAGKTPSIFSKADSRIEFCLAKTGPDGSSSSGITRYAFDGNFDNNEVQVKSSTGWDPERYLNIWVTESIDALGYAYLPSPSDLPEAEIDGVAILTSTFGDGPALEGPFDKGRTAIHEVGHYLGLDHIWGDGCNVDDGIGDTPNQSHQNEGCPIHPSPSCNNHGDMFMNYMDYADDACMFAFTAGQVQYMRQILQTSRRKLVQHGASICGSGNGGDNPTTPTCSDGIRNGEETGVDCGGSCPPCEVSSTVDLAISAIETISQGCGEAIAASVVIENNGASLVNSMKIEFSFDNNTTQTKISRMNIEAGQTKKVPLGTFTLNQGTHSIEATVILQGDVQPQNNSKQKDFAVQSKNLQIVIQPDDFASEIEWELWNDDTDELIADGYDYRDGRNKKITEDLCLDDGCYSFVIYDLFGDGICCDWGKGWFKLKNANNQVIVQSNGNYGYSDVQSFCINGGEPAAAKAGYQISSQKINRIKQKKDQRAPKLVRKE